MSKTFPLNHSVRRYPGSVKVGAMAVAACFASQVVIANPSNPVVVAGSATFAQTGSTLTVTNSNGAIINWDRFSIKAGETTHFAQSSASSSVLNRVLNDPTAIYGTLSSNGRVWLINPAGILVGPGARIDTAGFVASTLNLRNEDFLAGRKLFENTPGAGNVINQGEIRTPSGGSVYLVGSGVSNEGIIRTPQGETILAAGATVSLIDSATPGVKVDITGAAGNATNIGEITAEAGRVGIAGVIVRNSGVVNASSAVSEGGRVFLKASRDAYVDGNGRIVTTGTRGGRVEVLGNRVTVAGAAEIDASGAAGGGKVLVGGDFQGRNPEVQNAAVTLVGPDTRIKADATNVGNGGTVIVWSDDSTRAQGSISARGGANGGDGGFVEVSGKRTLDFKAHVDTLAPRGRTGTLLLDPGSLSIDDTDWATNYQPQSSDLILQTDDTGTGDIVFSGSCADNSFGHNLSVLAYGAGISTGNISFSNFKLNVAGNLTAVAGWDGIDTVAPATTGTSASLAITDSKLMAGGAATLMAAGDLTASAINFGVMVQSGGAMTVTADNIYLLAGSGTFAGPQGRAVLFQSGGAQTVTATGATGVVRLQAGSVNNTEYGGMGGWQYGGSVSLRSNSTQTVSANRIEVLAGLAGHDNGA